MAGGSGSTPESILPMILMSQASRIDPFTYGQSYVNDINQTIMETIAGASGQQQQQQQQQAAQSSGDGTNQQAMRANLPSKDDYNQTLMDALNYVNDIASYNESQHYDYATDSSGTKKRVKRSDATAEDQLYYDDHEKNAEAFDKLKEWNKKRRSTSSSTSTTSGGSSLLTGDLSSMFTSLLGGGQ